MNLNKQRGAALVLVALSMVMLVGALLLAVDVGAAYAVRRQLQNAADAGALAGAAVLARGGTDAQVWAEVDQYVGLNDATGFTAWYTPGGELVGAGSVPGDATGVRVTATGPLPSFFRKPFLRMMGDVAADADIDAESVAGSRFLPLDIMVVIDVSGSMEDDRYPHMNPMTDAKNAAKAFVDLNNPAVTRIGLVSYSDQFTLERGLTSNFNAVKTSINGLTADGCTNSEGGVYAARRELVQNGREDATPIIVFLTDGWPNVRLLGSGWNKYVQYSSSYSCYYCYTCDYDCWSRGYCSSYWRNYFRTHYDYRCPYMECPVAQQALREEVSRVADAGIVIYAISLGEGHEMMQEIADMTGGQAFHTPDSAELQAIYEEIFDLIMLRITE